MEVRKPMLSGAYRMTDGRQLPAQTESALKRSGLRIFVQLGRGFGAQQWTERWSRDEIPGVNERLPYGYFHAAEKGCVVKYSEDGAEGSPMKMLRSGLRRLLGFDLIHVWRNRNGIFNADVVWTHTEYEHLAVLALWQLFPPRRRPKLIAQSVWLFDRWQTLSPLTRWLYKRLLKQADVLTVLSPENLKVVRRLFRGSRAEFMPFGIDLNAMATPVLRAAHRPVRIVSVGNDMHRDWTTLIDAVKGWERCEVRIGSRRFKPRLARGARNVKVVRPVSAREVSELYAWADIAVVPLKPNLHASGITVIAEAVTFGLPVVATDTGGLRSYFPDEELCFVPPRDAAALRHTLEGLGANDEMRFTMAKSAQVRMRNANLSSRAFALRHFELSKELTGHNYAQ
jgi:glycosyltransferase involved in cell wall biosynthesis